MKIAWGFFMAIHFDDSLQNSSRACILAALWYLSIKAEIFLRTRKGYIGMKKRVLLVVGTRPEAIKLIPLYRALKNTSFDAILCATNQHTDLLSQACAIFDVVPDISLNIMQSNQDLFHVTQAVLEKMKQVYADFKPDFVIVQGDTTTAFSAALAAFYCKIPVAHVEAGLRSGDKFAPYPEEINRKFITQLADYHFAPTALNVAQLLNEGISREAVFCTGNTVVDALLLIKQKIECGDLLVSDPVKKRLQKEQLAGKKLMLLTAHRRESFDGGLLRVFKTIKNFMREHPDVFVFYPSHPNPLVLSAIEESGIRELDNIQISQPLTYIDLVYLLMTVDWVVTDSGGIQEEAVSLGKTVLVLRDVSERVECFWEGFGQLVGTNENLIASGLRDCYDAVGLKRPGSNVFGDGNAVGRIANILEKKICGKSRLYGEV